MVGIDDPPENGEKGEMVGGGRGGGHWGGKGKPSRFIMRSEGTRGPKCRKAS